MAKKVKITNLKDLTEDLAATYEELRAGKMTIDEAQAQSKVAGSILYTCKLQLNYNIFTKSDKKIGFMEY